MLISRKLCSQSYLKPRKNRVYTLSHYVASDDLKSPWKPDSETTNTSMDDGHCVEKYYLAYIVHSIL